MKLRSQLVILMALLSLLGCGSLVQEVDPGIVKVTPKLVVTSYISPQDTVLAVLVESSNVVLGVREYSNTNRFPVKGASVDLSDGIRTVRLAFSAFDGLYKGAIRNLPIVTGRTYTLTVQAANFPTTTAQCTVPTAVFPAELRIDSTVVTEFGHSRPTYYSRVLWQDPAGQANI